MDEKEFHLPSLKLFYNSNPLSAVESPSYTAANTPLPYIILSVPLKVLGFKPTITYARISNMFISFLTIILFIILLGVEIKNKLLPALILFFYPYFLKSSFTFFMSVYGLFFFLLFIFFVQKNDNINNLWAGVFLAFAVLCQQFYLIVYGCYTAFLIYKYFFKTEEKHSLEKVSLFLIPFIIPAALFFMWSGLTVSKFSFHVVSFQFVNIVSVLIIVSISVFPFLVFNIKEMNKSFLLVSLLLSLLLIIFVYPVWAKGAGAGKITGLTFHTISIIEGYSKIFAFIIKVGLCTMGICSLNILFKKIKTGGDKFFLFLIVCFAGGFLFNQLLSERHILPLIAMLYLFILSREEKPFILKSWFAYQLILGASYFYYLLCLSP